MGDQTRGRARDWKNCWKSGWKNGGLVQTNRRDQPEGGHHSAQRRPSRGEQNFAPRTLATRPQNHLTYCSCAGYAGAPPAHRTSHGPATHSHMPPPRTPKLRPSPHLCTMRVQVQGAAATPQALTCNPGNPDLAAATLGPLTLNLQPRNPLP
eukprot:358380-Chlamydomonas_euryale.AAC.6